MAKTSHAWNFLKKLVMRGIFCAQEVVKAMVKEQRRNTRGIFLK